MVKLLQRGWILLLLAACQAPGPHEPEPIAVLDTDFSKGRLAHRQSVRLTDLEKFHGHRCDGLVLGYLALQEALSQLYPQGPVDRSDLRIAALPSPCLADAAIYLTGGRYQYHSFYVDPHLPGLFALQRQSDSTSLYIALKAGLKPAAIDSLGALAMAGQLSPCLIDSLRRLEDQFSAFLLESTPGELFEIRAAPDFRWQVQSKNDYRKSDILNKDLPACSD